MMHMILPATYLAFDCPCCSARNIDPYIFDGDTITPKLPFSLPIACGLARAWNHRSYHARLEFFSCCECKCPAAIAKLSVVDTDLISYSWANAYIWLNEDTPEQVQQGIAELTDEGIHLRWPIEITATDAGMLVTHYFGPHTLGACFLQVAQAQIVSMLPLVASEGIEAAYRSYLAALGTCQHPSPRDVP